MFFHKLFYTVDIDYRAKIAGGFRVAHGMCIVIGRYVVIEENVTIYQGVTLGGNSGKTREIMGEQRSQPYIHKNATLYTGCSVFGPCEIGENSVIGAHTVITKDVDANTIVHTSNEIVVTEVKTKEQ